jgi:hypothetical protein
MKIIINIIIFAVIFIILLSPYYEIWGNSNVNETYINNKSKSHHYSNSTDIAELMGVLSTGDTRSTHREWIEVNPISLPPPSSPLVIDVFPDRKDYTYFEDIRIFFKVSGNNSQPIKLIFEERDSTNKIVYKGSKSIDLTKLNNSKGSFGFHPKEFGTYNASIIAIQGSNSEKASTTYNVIPFTSTNLFYFILLGMSFFFGLLFFTAYGLKNTVIDEILRFILLSGLVASFLASLLFTDIQFGSQGPLGLIRDTDPLNIVTQNDTKEQNWVFNIGGAIQIPIYVVVFGLIGGYIRYLYKTSRLLIEQHTTTKKQVLENKIKPENDRSLIFLQSLRDIALFLLSPILAIVVYFLLFKIGMSGLDATYTIAVACFGVGLVTDDIIQKLINFTSNQTSNINSKKNSDGKVDDDTNNLA